VGERVDRAIERMELAALHTLYDFPDHSAKERSPEPNSERGGNRPVEPEQGPGLEGQCVGRSKPCVSREIQPPRAPTCFAR